jgi:hypothetical protein
LAIWDSDAEGEIRRKVDERQIQKPLRIRDGFNGIQYHLYNFLSKTANLAGTYIGGSGNEGKADCAVSLGFLITSTTPYTRCGSLFKFSLYMLTHLTSGV